MPIRRLIQTLSQAPRRRDQRRRLQVEGLENRDLLAPAPLLVGSGPPRIRDIALLDNSNRQLTPREQALSRFVATFQGTFVTGPGRFTDEAAQTLILSGGGSNMFLKGDAQLAYFRSIDPAAPVTGNAILMDLNIGDSGNLLVFDIQADPNTLDRAGRVTRFNWTVADGDGTFLGAEGSGTGEIRYRPKQSPRPGIIGGDAGLIFRGEIRVNRVFNQFMRQLRLSF